MDQGETDKPKIPFVKFIMFSIVHVAFLCNTYNIVIKLLYGNSVSFLCITTNTFLFFYIKNMKIGVIIPEHFSVLPC